MRPVITVGLDASTESLAAARWAADEAHERKLALRLLHAWPMLAPEPPVFPRKSSRITGRSALSTPHSQNSKHATRHPGVKVTEIFRLTSPAEAVLEASAGATLLVVGRRRHRPGLASLLGPVAQAAVHHGRCPVAVIPHD